MRVGTRAEVRGLRALRDVVRAREDLRGDLIVATRTELRAITEPKVKVRPSTPARSRGCSTPGCCTAAG